MIPTSGLSATDPEPLIPDPDPTHAPTIPDPDPTHTPTIPDPEPNTSPLVPDSPLIGDAHLS